MDGVEDPTPNILERLIANEERQEKRQARRADATRAFTMMLQENPLYTYYRMIASDMGLKKKDIAHRLGMTPARLSMFESRLAQKLRPAKKSR